MLPCQRLLECNGRSDQSMTNSNAGLNLPFSLQALPMATPPSSRTSQGLPGLDLFEDAAVEQAVRSGWSSMTGTSQASFVTAAAAGPLHEQAEDLYLLPEQAAEAGLLGAISLPAADDEQYPAADLHAAAELSQTAASPTHAPARPDAGQHSIQPSMSTSASGHAARAVQQPEQPAAGLQVAEERQFSWPSPQVQQAPGSFACSPVAQHPLGQHSISSQPWTWHSLPDELAEASTPPTSASRLPRQSNAMGHGYDHSNPLYGQDRTPRTGPPSARGYRQFQMPAVRSSADCLPQTASADDVLAHRPSSTPARSQSWDMAAAHLPVGFDAEPEQLDGENSSSVANASLQQLLSLPPQVQAQLDTMQTPRGSTKPIVTAHIPLTRGRTQMQQVRLSLSAESSAVSLTDASQHDASLSRQTQQGFMPGIASGPQLEAGLFELGTGRSSGNGSAILSARRRSALDKLKQQTQQRIVVDR